MQDSPHDLTGRISRLEEAIREMRDRLRDLEVFVGFRAPPVEPAEPPALRLPAFPDIPPDYPSHIPSTVSAESSDAGRKPSFHFPQFSGELEVLIGTSWLNRIGVIAIIVAAAFFLKFAFDNNWVGPAGRVALTLLAGIALVLGGERYQRRGLPTFGQGLTGGGLVIIYLGVFAAFEIYRLIAFAPAFVLMVLITLAATVLALRYDSKVIALLSFLGGFATPLALGDSGSSGGPAQPVTPALYAYFLALDAGGYVLTRYKGWKEFGVVILVVAFLVPAIVASGGKPNPDAALVYFFAVTIGTLGLSILYSTRVLAWMALVGGFVLGPWSGVWEMVSKAPLATLGYFAAVTLAAMYAAVEHGSPGVAFAALGLGTVFGLGFAIDSSPIPDFAIFAYLIVVGGSALYAAIRHDWRWVEWAAAALIGGAATAVATLGIPSELRTIGPWRALSGVTAVFLTFSLTATMTSRRRPEIRLVTVILAAAIYGAQLLILLETRDMEALAAVILAAYHVATGRVLLRRAYPQLAVLVLAGLALTFLTIAIPLKLRAQAVPLAWWVETAVLAWAAGQLRNVWAGRAAAIVGALAVVRVVIYETPLIAIAGFVATPPGLSFAVGVTALILSAHFTRRVNWNRDDERYIPAGLLAAGAGLLLWWVGWEIHGLDARGQIGTGSKHALLSAWFTLSGFSLVVIGIWREVPAARWAGIGLLGLTIGKVFLVDLAQVEMAYRILSLLVLGVLLVAASFVYGRYRTRLGSHVGRTR